MEIFYTAYTKIVNGETFYFVKKFNAFPELKNVPAILENYGMHTDFEQACNIAMVGDNNIRRQLLNDLELNTSGAKLVQMNGGKAINGINNDRLNNAQQAI